MKTKTEYILISSNEDPTTYVVDCSCGTNVKTLKSNIPSIGGLTMLSTTNYMSAIQHNKLLINIYNLSKDVPLYKCHLPEKMGPLISTKDGSFLIAGSVSGKLYVWDVYSGELLNVWNAHYKAIRCLSITDDSYHIISGGDDAIINVWRIEDVLDECVSRSIIPVCSWTEHSLPITSIHCGVGGVNGRIISTSLDRTCKIWDIPSGRRIFSITAPSSIRCCAMDTLELRLILGCEDGKLYSVNLHAATCHSSSGSNVRIPLDGIQSAESSISQQIFEGHTHPITCVAASADGSYIVSGDQIGSVRLWDCRSYQTLKCIESLKGGISCLQFTGNPLAFSSTQIAISPLKKYMCNNSK